MGQEVVVQAIEPRVGSQVEMGSQQKWVGAGEGVGYHLGHLMGWVGGMHGWWDVGIV